MTNNFHVHLRSVRGSQPGPADRATLALLPGTYYMQETLKLAAERDAYLDIIAFSTGVPVILSGGQVLDLAVFSQEGDVRTGTFPGTCAEVFLDSWRLLPARSPNTAWGPNMTVAKGPYHSVTDVLEETSTCRRSESVKFKQNCPASNRDGFVVSEELSEGWEHLDQTKIMIFHSWINEYAKVGSVSTVGGRKEVRFQSPLKHEPVGQYPKSGNWRFLVLNNRAVLDQEGEVVCVQEGDQAMVSYIPPAGLESTPPVLAVLETLISIARTSSITLTGLQFEHTSSADLDGYAWGPQSAVKLDRVEDSTIDNCEFTHIGRVGMYLRGVTRVSVTNSLFWDIGSHGVLAMSRSGTEISHMLIDSNIFMGCGATG